MPSLLLDRIENARVETSFTTTKYYRSFVAIDINTSFASLELASVLSIPGMPQVGDLLPGRVFTKVINHAIETASGTIAKGTIIYEGPRDEIAFAFIAEQSATLVQRAREYIKTPSGYLATQVKYQNQTTGSDGSPLTIITTKTASISPMLPCITVRLSTFSVPFPFFLPKFGTVNAAAMTGNLYSEAPGIGFWLFAGRDIKTQSDGVNYDVSLTLISLVDSDWSEYEVYRQPNGEQVIVKTSVMNSLANGSYVNDITQGMDSGAFAGVAKIGPYSTADFTLFNTYNVA